MEICRGFVKKPAHKQARTGVIICRGGCMRMRRFVMLLAMVMWSMPLLAQQPLRITVDVKPGDDKVTLEPEREGMVPVLIVTTPAFDAAKVDPDTVRVGPGGTEASIFRSMLEDV